MKMIYTEIVQWNGKRIHREFYKTDSFDSVPKNRAFQSQAVCFVNSNDVVIFEDTDGHRGMPGGHIEVGESFEETLKREIYEESACLLLSCGPTCYIKEWEENSPEVLSYGLRYWAVVKPLDEEADDPCREGRKRKIVSYDNASKLIGWGNSADVLIELAKEKVKF